MGIANNYKFNKQLQELESYFKNTDVVNNNVSKASVGWHTFHSLKVINRVCSAAITSDPKTYKWRFNFLRLFSLAFKYFPRGKAKAPKVVLPPETFQLIDLEAQMKDAKQNIIKLNSVDPHANITHHIFGQLAKKEIQIFLAIHTEHHLKIIRDILKD